MRDFADAAAGYSRYRDAPVDDPAWVPPASFRRRDVGETGVEDVVMEDEEEEEEEVDDDLELVRVIPPR